MRKAFAEASYYIAIKRSPVDEQGIRDLFADLYPEDPAAMKARPKNATLLCLTQPLNEPISIPYVMLDQPQDISAAYISIKATLEKEITETPTTTPPFVFVTHSGEPMVVTATPATASIFLGNRYLGTSPQTIDQNQTSKDPCLLFLSGTTRFVPST